MRNGKPMECEVPLRQPSIRCAIYTRKSSEEGLQQEFNSLDAQRESAEAFIASQRGQGWQVKPELYDDGAHATFTELGHDAVVGNRLLRAHLCVSSGMIAPAVSPTPE